MQLAGTLSLPMETLPQRDYLANKLPVILASQSPRPQSCIADLMWVDFFAERGLTEKKTALTKIKWHMPQARDVVHSEFPDFIFRLFSFWVIFWTELGTVD
ncbi:hypothetical protein TNCV_5076161 [Trichonephila clavipes]|uniref:Uncharacterized protein n=1 Tax=Trichonephila clavipes TaxID=2585209 RepID=A0A8X6VB83_TRICX|nr:hypothetical protein TNCV_5076161 [Trichonephila clavipes]